MALSGRIMQMVGGGGGGEGGALGQCSGNIIVAEFGLGSRNGTPTSNIHYN